MLMASVAAGPSGPVIQLYGEADHTQVGQLSGLISAQLANGTQELTIDLSRLEFADSASVRTLLLAARTLSKRGGRLVLLNPQHPVTRILAIMGADQLLTIRGHTPGKPESDGTS